jgi:dTDP-4-amino-4,6-dideoxygalactose transaminase
MFERLRNAGILVNLHYIPVYSQPFYAKKGYRREDFPNAEAYYSEAISIPMYSAMTSEQQSQVIEMINKPAGFQNLF